MNCEEFQQRLMTDPRNDSQEFQQHLANCQSCREQYEDALVFEKKLKNAFKSPSAEPSSLIHQQFLDEKKSRKKRKSAAWAVAAGLLVIVASGFVVNQIKDKWSMTDFVLAHIDHEIEQLGNTEVISASGLQHYFAKFNSPYLSVLDSITYAEKCWMRTSYGLHLILQGEKGPVTLLLMPGEQVQETLDVTSVRFQGKVYALQQGSIALVGVPGEPIEMIAESIRMAMQDMINGS